jgi:hypothetical protein
MSMFQSLDAIALSGAVVRKDTLPLLGQVHCGKASRLGLIRPERHDRIRQIRCLGMEQILTNEKLMAAK